MAITAARAPSVPRPGIALDPGKILAWLMLAGFVLWTLVPLLIALKTAFTGNRELFAMPERLVPAAPTLANFGRVLGLSAGGGAEGGIEGATFDFALALRNSAILTVIVVSGQVFFSALAAYAFARLTFVGRDLVFYMFLSATMIPTVALFIPNFLLIRDLGWLNTFQGMAAPFFLMTPYAVFFLRQFFLTTPVELEEAARIDGAGPFGIFWRVVLPLHKGAIATLVVLVSINTWNEFFWPFLVGGDESVRPMSVAINAFKAQQEETTPDWGGLMACTFLSIIPIVLVLFFFGRKVVESIQFTGTK